VGSLRDGYAGLLFTAKSYDGGVGGILLPCLAIKALWHWANGQHHPLSTAFNTFAYL
jgi:hypothetical protein